MYKFLSDLIDFIIKIAPTCLIIWGFYEGNKWLKNNIYLEKEKIKQKIIYDLYEEIRKKISIVSQKSVSFSSDLSSISMNLDLFSKGFYIKEIKSIKKIIDEKYDLDTEIISLTKEIEDKEIAYPRLKIFNFAFSSILNDSGHSLSELIKIYPHNLDKLDMAKIPEIAEKIKKINDIFLDLGGYLYDLRIEIQNTMLGEIFNRTIPKRSPMDPNVIVISTDESSYSKLKHYFENETNLAKKKKAAENRVSRNLN